MFEAQFEASRKHLIQYALFIQFEVGKLYSIRDYYHNWRVYPTYHPLWQIENEIKTIFLSTTTHQLNYSLKSN